MRPQWKRWKALHEWAPDDGPADPPPPTPYRHEHRCDDCGASVFPADHERRPVRCCNCRAERVYAAIAARPFARNCLELARTPPSKKAPDGLGLRVVRGGKAA